MISTVDSPGPVSPGGLRSAHHRHFDAATLAAARTGRRVAVCIPARDEAGTVGAVVESVRLALTVAGGGVDLVDEVVVVDDGSLDDTDGVARRAGARVVPRPDRAGQG